MFWNGGSGAIAKIKKVYCLDMNFCWYMGRQLRAMYHKRWFKMRRGSVTAIESGFVAILSCQ